MWSGSNTSKQRGSGVQPLPIPGVDPLATPLVYIGVNGAWLPYIFGALWQMYHPAYWATSNPATLTTVQCQVAELLGAVAIASAIPAPVYRHHTNGSFQVSLDGGTTWTTLLLFSNAPPSGDVAVTAGADYQFNAAPFPIVYDPATDALLVRS